MGPDALIKDVFLDSDTDLMVLSFVPKQRPTETSSSDLLVSLIDIAPSMLEVLSIDSLPILPACWEAVPSYGHTVSDRRKHEGAVAHQCGRRAAGGVKPILANIRV